MSEDEEAGTSNRIAAIKNLKVAQLKSELAKRDLKVTGLKKALQKRLREAYEMEDKAEADKINEEKRKVQELREKTIAVIPEEAQTNRMQGYLFKWDEEKGNGVITITNDKTLEGQDVHVIKEDFILHDEQKMCRVNQQVELTVELGSRLVGKYVCGPGGKKLHYDTLTNPEAKKVVDRKKDKDTRFLGYVKSWSWKQGYGTLSFAKKGDDYRHVRVSSAALRCSGMQHVRVDDAVEFTVRFVGGVMTGRNVTRPGGGVITYERGILGRTLRMGDKLQKDRPELKESEDRIKGLVESFSNDKGYGFIIPQMKDDYYRHVPVVGNEIKATGFKLLRPGSKVTFSTGKMKGSDGIEKVHAMEVKNGADEPITWEDGKVGGFLRKLGKIFEDQEPCPVDPEKVLKGWCKRFPFGGSFGWIQPANGCQHLQVTYNQIYWLGKGFPHLKVGAEVEFRAAYDLNKKVIAIKVTKPKGEPFSRAPPLETPPQEPIDAVEALNINSNALEYYGKEYTKEIYEKEQIDNASKLQLAKKRKAETLINARPRPKTCAKVYEGVVVDFKVSKGEGWITPFADDRGGEIKGPLKFKQNNIRCDGFRAVEKWQEVQFTPKVINDEATAAYVTGKNCTLLRFDEEAFKERQKENARLRDAREKMPWMKWYNSTCSVCLTDEWPARNGLKRSSSRSPWITRRVGGVGGGGGMWPAYGPRAWPMYNRGAAWRRGGYRRWRGRGRKGRGRKRKQHPK